MRTVAWTCNAPAGSSASGSKKPMRAEDGVWVGGSKPPRTPPLAAAAAVGLRGAEGGAAPGDTDRCWGADAAASPTTSAAAASAGSGNGIGAPGPPGGRCRRRWCCWGDRVWGEGGVWGPAAAGTTSAACNVSGSTRATGDFAVAARRPPRERGREAPSTTVAAGRVPPPTHVRCPPLWGGRGVGGIIMTPPVQPPLAPWPPRPAMGGASSSRSTPCAAAATGDPLLPPCTGAK